MKDLEKLLIHAYNTGYKCGYLDAIAGRSMELLPRKKGEQGKKKR